MTTGANPAGLEIFLGATPGLEPLLAEEAREAGFAAPEAVPGGVLTRGGWPEVWRANLVLRGTGRVLVRLATFPALHLAQLDKRARRVAWADVLGAQVPVRVDAACQGSRIWHAGAAAERVARAITAATGAPAAPGAAVRVLVRLVDNLCTISLDTSGEPLHKRGAKQAVVKAPLRETLAALFLRACGYRGDEPVVDPMCGSGTFVLEAAEIAAGLAPGRARAFAFEHLAAFDPDAWERLRREAAPRTPAFPAFGCDRDAGAIAASRANAERAGVAEATRFAVQPISALVPPEDLAGTPGLVMVNPPYGGRIGEREALPPLYRTLGRVLAERFAGWRVGLVTSEPRLAQATGLPFADEGPPVPHGSLRIRLYRTDPLG
jgi:putative N6-adenine-specific DNA methylase